jgi:hypothetical protein
MRDALDAARPFFEDLARALDGRELVIVAGNHDHALVEPWLAGRGQEHEPAPLEIEQLLEPGEASPACERIAGWASAARTRVAYPGLWLRSDVYATHGHYLDSHLTMPTLERLSLGAMSRMLGKPPDTFAAVRDYEAVGAPLFAWRDAVARDARTGATLNGMATAAVWSALTGADKRDGSDRPSLSRRLRARALAGLFPLAVAALNRAGIGPLRADLSLVELRRAGLLAIGEVAARLDLGEAYVVFGHTHRAGPFPDDDQAEWRGHGGARLVNCGSWTYSSFFLGRGFATNPYWPGTAVLVADDGPPEVIRLLADRTPAQLAPPRRRRGGEPQVSGADR